VRSRVTLAPTTPAWCRSIIPTVFAVLTGRLKIVGKRALLDCFAACFPR